MADFSDIVNLLSGSEFEEVPVEVEEFVYSSNYLGLLPLSEYQMTMLRTMTQVLRLDTLIAAYGPEKGAERFEETYREVILQLGKGCHAPYTPIFNPETGGWNSGDGLVASSDGQNHYATEAFAEGIGQMVRVTTALGFVEDVYVGHKYLSYTKSGFYHRCRGIDPDYRAISDLSPGDRIAIGIGFETADPTNIPLEHAELIGYWLGDGMLPADHNKIINMDFCSDEVESIQRYEHLCAFIGDSPTKTVHPSKNMTSFRHGVNSKAVSLADEYGLWGMRSKTKDIPAQVWAASNEVLAAVVSKLWQADGCLYQKNGLTAEFVSSSENLAVAVQRALLRLGVPSSIRSRVPKSNFDNASMAWYVTVSSQECIDAFLDAVELLDHKSHSKQQKTGRVYKRISGNVYYDRVKSIEPLGVGEYWTRSVPETGNYVGNGMISANSGKDFVSTIACAYIVYQLLCLKDPARYYGKNSGDAIDIINIAVNADQARNVFFNAFKQKIHKCPWFQGKYSATMDSIRFDKNITVYSGHSEREAFEGYNVFVAILDEIAGFAVENTSGSKQAKTADEIYRMYRGSVTSRFSEFGKVLLLSFPRYKGDYIQTRYKAAIMDKETIIRSETRIVNPDLPHDTPGNTVTVEWEEDHITRYRNPGIFCLKRPSWEVNPTKRLEDYIPDYLADPVDMLARFACMPPEAVDAFFKSREKVELAFNNPRQGVDEAGKFEDDFKPDETKTYYIHVDLAQKVDRAAVTMAHVEKWVEVRPVPHMTGKLQPLVVVDAVRWWTPTSSKNIDFADIRDYILDLHRLGFNIKLVTFDRWNSTALIDELGAFGIKCEILSVAKTHYISMQYTLMEERLKGPYNKLLIDELMQLQVIKDKVDHPRSGGKDLADATCGAIFNAIEHTPKITQVEVDVHLYKQTKIEKAEHLPPKVEKPTTPPPASVQAFLDAMQVL
jgi:intein/homing endonuclease